MLSPAVSIFPQEGTQSPEQSTRRRGLSYLRGLSSHSSNTSDQPRSPRSFFQRSTSYNSESKAKTSAGRRRSASRPNEPTGRVREQPDLTRVLSAGNSPIPSPVPPQEDNSSGDDRRQPKLEEQTPENAQAAVAISSDMARLSRPTTPRRLTDTAVSSGTEQPRPKVSGNTRPASSSFSNGAAAINGTAATAKAADDEKIKLPTIRFFPHQDLRNNGRQSLNFSPISRTLPGESSVIRIGRYSEREGPPVANPTHPSDAPVGFKSKVVSRKHCEFSFVDGQWHLRDVASSSGTFLNHIRLSQPNQESRLFPVKDGDIVQLGIDFRGGEEMIFRCVKIRIECNRSWQKKPNNFNKTRQAQLLGLTKDQPTGGQNNGECSICLGSVLPCQALFVAPCAHVWHYKCIRPMIEGRQAQYPSFQCPNCRAWTDLEADVDVAEEDMDAWMENGGDTDDHLEADPTEQPQTGEIVVPARDGPTDNGQLLVESATPPAATPSEKTATTNGNGLLSRRALEGGSETVPVNSIPIPGRLGVDEMGNQLARQQALNEPSTSDHAIVSEGPLTPRNNAGPFVFDGSGAAGESRARTAFVPGLFNVTENTQA